MCSQSYSARGSLISGCRQSKYRISRRISCDIQNSSPPNSHYSLRVWIRRSDEETRRISPPKGPLNPIYRHRLFSDEEFYIATFPIDVYSQPPIRKNGASSHRNSNPPPQPTVLATPEDITDRKHILSALISGITMRYIISWVFSSPHSTVQEFMESLGS